MQFRYSGKLFEDLANDTSWAWKPRKADYNFTFYSYTPKQKIYFSAVDYKKPNEANVIYKDENGFLKIS